MINIEDFCPRTGPVDLSTISTAYDGGITKDAAKVEIQKLRDKLALLQEQLFAGQQHRLLIIAQGIDTAGKDGLLGGLLGPMNPSGISVTSFGVPSEAELAHDYLWRAHPHVPANGEVAAFNRSHYEDVLVVRVKKLVERDRWERRYRHICDFERMLTDEGTTIVKIFLHLSRDEQAERLQARLDEPDKRWKFRSGDLADRALWDDYQQAFCDMIERTRDPVPWWVIPADRKWFRDLAAASVLVSILEGLRMGWPAGEPDLEGVEIPR